MVRSRPWTAQPAPAQRIADGGAALRDTVGVVITTAPQWSADSRWVYYRALIGGEVYQVWRAARDGLRAPRR